MTMTRSGYLQPGDSTAIGSYPCNSLILFVWTFDYPPYAASAWCVTPPVVPQNRKITA